MAGCGEAQGWKAAISLARQRVFGGGGSGCWGACLCRAVHKDPALEMPPCGTVMASTAVIMAAGDSDNQRCEILRWPNTATAVDSLLSIPSYVSCRS